MLPLDCSQSWVVLALYTKREKRLLLLFRLGWNTIARLFRTCLLINGIFHLPSLASPIVAFNTSSVKESSNWRNDEPSDSTRSSLVTKFFYQGQWGGSYNWFQYSSRRMSFHFSTPCNGNSTTREIQLRKSFVYGETWRKPQSCSIITLGLYSNHVIMDTEGPQKVSVLPGFPH